MRGVREEKEGGKRQNIQGEVGMDNGSGENGACEEFGVCERCVIDGGRW